MEINNWNDFRNFINISVSNNQTFFYRGQMNSNWKLQTSFHRLTEHTNVTIPEYIDIALTELQYHFTAKENEMIDFQNPNDFGAFLAKVQHHGFPTPLLDWTLSPYIATYFALREVDLNSPQVSHIKVFIFDVNGWEQNFETILNLREIQTKFLSKFRPISKRNPRLISQMASTTVTNVNNIQLYIEKREKEVNKTFLHHVLLPIEDVPNIKKELDLMGINEMTLFPDIDGICRHFKNKFFNGLK